MEIARHQGYYLKPLVLLTSQDKITILGKELRWIIGQSLSHWLDWCVQCWLRLAASDYILYFNNPRDLSLQVKSRRKRVVISQL